MNPHCEVGLDLCDPITSNLCWPTGYQEIRQQHQIITITNITISLLLSLIYYYYYGIPSAIPCFAGKTFCPCNIILLGFVSFLVLIPNLSYTNLHTPRKSSLVQLYLYPPATSIFLQALAQSSFAFRLGLPTPAGEIPVNANRGVSFRFLPC